MLVVLGRLDHVHSVRAAQIVNMEHVVSFSHHVERIVTISLSTEAAVDVECTITIKHRPFAVFFPKRLLETLTNAIDIITLHLSADLEVFIAENKVPALCRK